MRGLGAEFRKDRDAEASLEVIAAMEPAIEEQFVDNGRSDSANNSEQYAHQQQFELMWPGRHGWNIGATHKTDVRRVPRRCEQYLIVTVKRALVDRLGGLEFEKQLTALILHLAHLQYLFTLDVDRTLELGFHLARVVQVFFLRLLETLAGFCQVRLQLE